jgi:predicted nucleic acid-binding protein
MAVSRGLADTSVFIARESGREIDVAGLPDQLSVSYVTIAELRAGVLAADGLDERDRRLATLTQALGLEPHPIDDAVAEWWARLRLRLRDAGKRMQVNDSWIAATAMSLDVPVVTQDNDYVEVEGLQVVKV